MLIVQGFHGTGGFWRLQLNWRFAGGREVGGRSRAIQNV
jgi:hypothetical protein